MWLVGIYPLIHVYEILYIRGSFFLKIYLLILENVIPFLTFEPRWSSKASNFPNFSIFRSSGAFVGEQGAGSHFLTCIFVNIHFPSYYVEWSKS